MSHFRGEDVAAFVRVLEQIHVPVDPHGFPAQLMAAIQQIMPGALITFNEIDLRTGAHRMETNFEFSDLVNWSQRVDELIATDHPIVKHMRNGGTEHVLEITDFVTQRQWRQTRYYSEIFRPLQMEYQMGVLLPVEYHVVGMAINRDRKFTARERKLMEMAAPHVIQAHGAAKLFSRLKAEAQSLKTQDLPDVVAQKLTPRERTVLHWVSEGKRDCEIATILGTQPSTVSRHVHHILQKLRVETRTSAARMARGL